MSGLVLARAACRLCRAPLGALTRRLHLPDVPVAGVYVEPADPREDPHGPLTLHRCARCGLVQLAESLDPAFYRDYRFASGTAESYRRHLALVADGVARLAPGGRALEVGSNDGTLLALMRDRGLAVAGFEPSAPGAAARDRGLAVVEDYFDGESARRSPLAPVDVLIARHVLEHLDDLDAFFAGAAAVAGPDAVLVVEVPDLASTAEARNAGNVYHPHAVYFDVATLAALLARHDWRLAAATVVPIFGGSLLAVAARGDAARLAAWPLPGGPARALAPEALDSFVAAWREDLADVTAFVRSRRAQGLRVAGWGAAERTAALVGMCGLGPADVFCLYDRNPALAGLALAGSRIPIREPGRLDVDRPDLVVVFARSFEEEIVASLAHYRAAGGRLATLRTRPPSEVPWP